MVGKLAPSSSHLTRGLVKHVPGRGYFRAVSYQNGDKFVTPPPPPIVELVMYSVADQVVRGLLGSSSESEEHLQRSSKRKYKKKARQRLERKTG